MGDRGNIRLEYGNDKCVYFYTHWHGSELNSIVRNALKRKERWDDPPYLARILFCELVKGEEEDATGFGIDVEVGDGDDQIITVDLENQKVTPLRGKKVSFEDFINGD